MTTPWGQPAKSGLTTTRRVADDVPDHDEAERHTQEPSRDVTHVELQSVQCGHGRARHDAHEPHGGRPRVVTERREFAAPRSEGCYGLLAWADACTSPLFSPADAISSAPVRLSTSFARVISSDVSQCTESRMPPFFTRPSYRLASNSGMPMPTNAPTRPPTAPPTPRAATAPMMGPAAVKGPTQGIAPAATR